MEIVKVQKEDIQGIKEIYLEAFPKRERKPFFSLKNAIKRNKAIVYVAKENKTICGFIVTYVLNNTVLVDYLAVSHKIRSKGTGSKLLQHVIQEFEGKVITLLIEKIDLRADNYEMRVSRKKFYLKNQFTSTNMYMDGASGEMEILSLGGSISPQQFLYLMKHALGSIYFQLSKIQLH